VAHPNLACANQYLPTAWPTAQRSVAPHHPGHLAMETVLAPEPCNKGRTPGHPSRAASVDHHVAHERQKPHRWQVSDAVHPVPALKGPLCPSSCPSHHRPNKPEPSTRTDHAASTAWINRVSAAASTAVSNRKQRPPDNRSSTADGGAGSGADDTTSGT